MSTDDLYSVGEEIIVFARTRGLPLEGGLGEARAPSEELPVLKAAGWDAWAPTNGFVRGSRYDEKTQSYAFLTEAEFAAPPVHLVCAVREFDVGKLAGQLREYRLLESSATRTLAEYTSVLPWPFRPRWLRTEMRFGAVKSTEALVILFRSVEGDGAAPPSGVKRGTVHYSLYHIRPAPSGRGRSIMRRVINVDMHIALPAMVLRSSLASRYQSDMGLLGQELAAWEGSALQRRLREGGYYRDMERALEEAGAAR